ncbi:MAG: sarcosine oxidase subunit gamma family protein [Pseudomonadota bacterium]
MADFATTHPLDAFFDRVEAEKSETVSVKVLENHGIVQVFAAKGKTAAVERALKVKETPGKATKGKDYTAIPLSPGQWMFVSANAGSDGFGDGIQARLKKNGYVSEQSDARVVFRISGDRARELMQKGCRLDLDPSAASKGWCAQTQMAQAGVIIHQVDDKPTYDILVYSGFAQHFAEWLEHTGAQLGIAFSR